MPDAVVIGKVAVKVIPDTSDFRRKTKAELDAIERGLDISVNVRPDTDALRRETEAARKSTEESLKSITIKVDLDEQDSVKRGITRLKSELAALKETKIKVKLDEADLTRQLGALETRLSEVERLELKVDPKSEASLNAALNKVEARLAEMREIKVNVKTDRSSLERVAADLKSRLAEAAEVKLKEDHAAAREVLNRIQDRFNALEWNIRPGLDPGKIQQVKREAERTLERIDDLEVSITPEMDDHAKHKVEREIDELKHKINNLKAEVEPEMSESRLTRVRLRIAELARDRFATIVPRLSKAAAAKVGTQLAALSGARALQHVGQSVTNFLTNLDKSVPKIALITSLLGALSASALTSTANILALGGSLASIGGAALGLPGLLGGMAIGATVTVVAFKDFKKYVPEVSAAWGKLKKTISENFWSKATKPIRGLVDGLLPEFTSGFAKASTQIGGYFGGLATDLKTSLKPALAGMFDDLSKSVSIATKGTGSIANSITVLGRVGAHLLPRLATYFNKVTGHLSDYLTKGEKSGHLNDLINQGVAAAKDLGNVLKNTGGILAGLNRAATAAGGSTLHMFANTLAGIHKTVDSPGFQHGMTNAFAAAFKAMHNIASIAGPQVKNALKTVGKTATAVLPQIGLTLGKALRSVGKVLASPAIQSGLKHLFDGIDDMVNALAPALEGLTPTFGALLDFIAQFASSLGPLMAGIADGFGPALTDVLKGLTPIMKTLTSTLGSAIRELSPGLDALAKGVVDMLKPISEKLAPAVRTVLPAFNDFMQSLAKVLPSVGSLLGSAAGPLADVASTLLSLGASVLIPISGALKLIADAFGAMPGPLKTIVLGLIAMKLAAPGISTLSTRIVGVGSSIRGVGTGLGGLRGAWANFRTQGITAAGAVNAALSAGVFGGLVGNVIGGKVGGKKGLIFSALGGAATGALIGSSIGPWGTAIGGLVGGVAGLAAGWKAQGDAAKTSADKAKQALAEEKQASEDLLGSLLSINDAYGEQYRAKIASEIGKTGALELAAKAGIASGALTDAVIGKGGSRGLAALNVQLENAAAAGKITFPQLSRIQGVIQKLGPAATTAQGRLALENAELGKGTLTADQLGVSMDKLKVSLAGTGTGLDNNTAAGKRNNLVISDNLTNLSKTVAAQIKSGTSVQDATKNYQAQIGTLKANLTQLGFNKDEVAALIAKYVKLPKSVSTEIAANSAPAKAAVAQITTKINNIKQGKVPGLTANNAEGKAAIRALQSSIAAIKQGTPPQIAVDTGDAMSRLQSLLAAIPKGTFHFNVQADYNAKRASGLARGGIVDGPGTETSDTAGVFRLSKREAVIPAKAVNENMDLVRALIARGRGLIGKSALANIVGRSAQMFTAGTDTIAGFVRGVSSSAPAIRSTLSDSGDHATRAFKRALDIHSPSKVFESLGKYTMQGFLKGIKSYEGQINSALLNIANSVTVSMSKTITKNLKDTIAADDKAVAALQKRIPKLKGKAKSAAVAQLASKSKESKELQVELKNYTKLRAPLQAQVKAVQAAVAAYDKGVAKVKDAQSKLADIKNQAADFKGGIVSSLFGAADITQVGHDFASMVSNLTDLRDQAKLFADTIAKLKAKGLNNDALQQLSNAGIKDGLAAAQTILGQGQAGVNTINSLQSQIKASSGNVAQTVTDAFYAAGINAAQGLVDGLLKQQKTLEATMAHLGDVLVKTLKTKLKIHSPSRVFAELGGYTMSGFQEGLESSYGDVHASLVRFSNKVGATRIDGPSVGSKLASLGDAFNGASQVDQRQFHYHAATNHSLPEEDVFAASRRARFAWT